MVDTDIYTKLVGLNDLIGEAAQRSGRERSDIRLVAVTKKQPIKRIEAYFEAAKALGVPILLGESYVQEFKAKRIDLELMGETHLIGPLQSNKIKDAVLLFDVIESVHTEKVLAGIAKEATKAGKIQRILLQVNISKDPAKSGFLPESVEAVVRQCLNEPNLRVDGLMTITALHDDAGSVRKDFKAMKELLGTLAGFRGRVSPLDHLSMGMSDDFEIAIEEGATLVRIGTRLFGERN